MKIRLSNPLKNKIVVFDSEGADILKVNILYDVDFTILHTRKDVFYLSVNILLLSIKNLSLFSFKELLLCKIFFGQLYRIYLYSCIEYIKPAKVITFIDNSVLFQWVAQKYKNCDFYAIQNGRRVQSSVSDWLPEPPRAGSVIFIPNFFCFGEHEKDLYTKYNHEIGRFFTVGSLRSNYYRRHLSSDKNIYFDICLVSEWEPEIFHSDFLPQIKKSLNILNEYLSRYIKEKKLSLCIALRSDDVLEEKYYTAIYGVSVHIIKNDRAKMSTYSSMEKSHIIVSSISTCGIEAFGWNKKVLMCNFSDDPNFDMQEGLWFIKDSQYDAFEKQMEKLRNLSEQDYLNLSAKYAKYLMEYNNGEAQDLIRKELFKEAIG